MEILDPGHFYKLAQLDVDQCAVESVRLLFVKREGLGYPGNTGNHPGTTLQEVFRVCIDRLQYVDRQISHRCNEAAIANLRQCILILETRAAERHNTTLAEFTGPIELVPVEANGHIAWRQNNG